MLTNNSVITDAAGAITAFVDIDDSGPPTSQTAGASVHVYTTGGGGACAATASLSVLNALADTPQIAGSPVTARDTNGGTRNLYIRQGVHNGPYNSHRGYGQTHVATSRQQTFAPGSTLWNTMLDIVRNNTPIWENGRVGGILKWVRPSDGWYVTSDEETISSIDNRARALITVSPPL